MPRKMRPEWESNLDPLDANSILCEFVTTSARESEPLNTITTRSLLSASNTSV
eukprot:CAMPEP_0173266186 /NCGR_PEP_ID=MMETSP1142-20121109/29020_1 /TAXON_ID=483371 /ORGANISM="non described non described, Strain CCMP2298" /LENGTH=52 /DNA_ID=CAMNT_0014202067 /DNA_START=30 /DNA_END=184 /DNA_ORIENTATION=+